jgi:hypothetical protein
LIKKYYTKIKMKMKKKEIFDFNKFDLFLAQ